MKTPVYLDYAATTPVDPRVAKAMTRCLTLDGNFANPASRSHVYGWKAEEAVEAARGNVAKLINADPREIVFTSGATESNNLAIKGLAFARQVAQSSPRHVITARSEHKAVLDTCAYLETQGFDVTYLTPPRSGIISAEQVSEALRAETVLVSLMHVNNEVGVINDIAAIGALCRSKHVAFHVDAAQSLGKVLVDVKALNIDLMSISAGKMYGPKGIGALYVRRHSEIRMQAQMHGGGHERGMRSGTLPTHQIVGLGEAARIALDETQSDEARLAKLRDGFVDKLAKIPELYFNGDMTQRIAGNVNFSVAGVEGESLLMSLRDLALSTGSACTSVSVEPSYVLTALGVPRDLAHSSLRISFGKYTTREELDFAAEKIAQAVSTLRELSPSWDARVKTPSTT